MAASFSALSPSEIVQRGSIAGLTMRQPRVVECSVSLPAGNARDGLRTTHGARVIDSTPPATTSAASSQRIARAAWIAASRLEPQRRLTVAPVTVVGSPASSAAIRATLRLSSPAALAAPRMTSSIAAGSGSPARASSARRACVARSSGRTPARAPPKRPKGVRTAS